jgi:trans-aconitate methyltransferase
MDDATLSAYDRDAKAFANDWDAQPPPSDLHAVVGQFFIHGPTADVGCGSGRDAAWLNACGYPTKGFDASEGLLAEARRRHPEVHFSTAIPGPRWHLGTHTADFRHGRSSLPEENILT